MSEPTGGDDYTLLDKMATSFCAGHEAGKIQSTSKKSGLDLGEMIAGQEEDFDGDDEKDLESDNYALEVLFVRDGPLFNEQDDQMSLVATISKKSIPAANTEPETGDSKRAHNKCKFFQTRNENYRNFMEEVMLVKYCSKKILHHLEDTQLALQQHVEIKNVPGFDKVITTQAWVWVLKETITSASVAMQSDNKRSKRLNLFLDQLQSRTKQSFKQLISDTKTVSETLKKVWQEICILSGQAFERFSNNLENSFEYELKSSGWSFFLHRRDSVDSVTDTTQQTAMDGANGESRGDCDQSLKVRCSVDGVTLNTGKEDSTWIKFQKIDQDRDIFILLGLFFNQLIDTCAKVRKNLYLVHELLEVHKRSAQENSNFRDSILHSILKCQKILNIPQSKVNYFPKEEAIMLYTLKTTRASLDLMKPLIEELEMLSNFHYSIIREFVKQDKLLKKGIVSNRFPANMNARFELFIQDTQLNTDIMLNRYPNIRDARELKDRLIRKCSGIGGFFQRDKQSEDPIDILYKCPSKVFTVPSSQEIIEMFRKLINQQRFLRSPNPAHFLFADVDQEYTVLTKELTSSRKITSEILSLCCDPIQRFYRAVEEQAAFKDKILTQIVDASQKLTYTQSGKLSKRKTTPIMTWIQAFCKILHVWDFHSLPRRLKKHFLAKNDATAGWITRLEDKLREFDDVVKVYKRDLNDFQDFIQTNHGFATWVRRIFDFNPPNEILEKIPEEQEEDFLEEEAMRFELHFQDFDMNFIMINEEEGTATTLATLNKCTRRAQVGMVGSLLAYFGKIVSSAIVNLNCARAMHEKYLNLKTLKDVLCPDKKLECIRNIYQLEDFVLTLTFETLQKNLKETIAYIGFLHDSIGQFNQMFQTVQLHLEERDIAGDQFEPQLVDKSANRRKSDREAELRNDDKYLNEAMQLLKTSVEVMPNVFEIREQELIRAYLSWAKFSEQEAKIMFNVAPAPLVIDGQEEDEDDEVGEEDEKDKSWPMTLEEAMIQSLTGKSFFPDPDQFMSGLESWRTMCFKMLSVALDRFREMTTTKIIDTKLVLSSPQSSETSITEKRENVNSVGYAETLSSLLYLMTEQLEPKDCTGVPLTDFKLLKEKFGTATNAIGKFKKCLEAAEKVLVNNLSLSMASVENKRLPQYLPVLPLESDFLKNHDLDEMNVSQSLSHKHVLRDISGESSKGSQKSVLWSANTISERLVEIDWDSMCRDKIICKIYDQEGNCTNEYVFSQLQVNGQLHLMHNLLNEIIQEFYKAIDLVKEAKKDLLCAKDLLESTWKGLGKDLKKRRMPGSSVVVLLKLYRHQVATAVVNLQSVKKMVEEVKYILSKSTKNASMWANGKNPKGLACINKNLHISLSVSLKVIEPDQCWLTTDDEKVADQEEKEMSVMHQKLEAKPILEIKSAVHVSSSTALLKSTKSVGDPFYQVNSSVTVGVDENVTSSDQNNTFHETAVTIQKLMLGKMSESLGLLTLTNYHPISLEGQWERSNLMAVLASLVSVTMDVYFFKEVLPNDRNLILRTFTSLLDQIGRLRNNGVLETITIESEKQKQAMQKLDANFRARFSVGGEFPSIEEFHASPFHPTNGITPLEFLQGLATDIHGHVWTITCGIPDIGTVIKNNKTLESHAVANIPLSCKLELFLSIVNYLEKLVNHVHSNLETARKDIASSRSLLKSKGKETPWQNKKRILGMLWKAEDVAMSKGEIKDLLNSFARIYGACVKAHENASQILELLQKANEIIQKVCIYISIKFKLEPSVRPPNVDANIKMRAQNWQTVDTIAGVANPPNVPPPVILKQITRKTQKLENDQKKYKTAWEHKLLELEVYFESISKQHQISVDVPIKFAPVSTLDYGEDYDDEN